MGPFVTPSQNLPGSIKAAFLVLRVAVHLLAGKLLLKRLHIQQDALHAFQNDLLHHFLTDIVSRTDLGILR